jgi:arylformamidase
MVDECRHELAAVVDLARPSAVVVAGHSAGAHLTAMVSLVATAPCRVDRIVLVSGVYDLRPLVGTTVNDALGLDVAAASLLSPALLTVAATPDVVVAWGDRDTRTFARQSESYSARLVAAGVSVDSFECAGRHHFDIVDDLVDPTTRLGAAALACPSAQTGSTL